MSSKPNKYTNFNILIGPILLFQLIFNSAIVSSQEVFRYISSVDHVDQNLWVTLYERNFDSSGIITQKKEYHALTIAGFGIMSYENFITTGDSVYYKHAVNQYKYFCDSSKINYIDNFSGMGLPYKFKFHDLKPPWYSGMTQGVAISFLLRYYKLTGDKEVLKKVQQLAYFMLRPEKIGGTIGKTPEGYTFIEEYPNSKNNKQVLNGFINGLVGIREYLNFFPEDTLAKRIHDESYEAMIKTFNKYDLPDNWTTYNRNNKKISNFYLRYQITELEFLNTIYADYRLVKQMMLWSYFAFNKLEKNLSEYKYPRYQYAIPFQLDQDKISSSNIEFEKTLLSSANYSVIRNSKSSDNQLKHKKIHQINLKDSVYTFHVSFDKNIESNAWNLKPANKKNASDSVNFELDSTKMVVTSKEKFNQLEIQFLNKKEKKLNITDLQVYNPYQFEIPRFGFYNFANLHELHADSLYQIETKGEYLDESIVFYRCSENRESIKNAKYEIDNTINLSHPYFIPKKTGVYQFFLSSPMIKGLWFEKPEVKLVQNTSHFDSRNLFIK
jgi:hypothetical protein